MKTALLVIVALGLALSACTAPEEAQPPATTEVQNSTPPEGLPLSPAPSEQAPGLGRSTLNNPNITVRQTYTFDSQRWGDIVWTLDLPVSLYNYYREKTRPAVYFNYAEMAADPKDDDIIAAVIRNVNETAAAKGISRKDLLNLVLSFVQKGLVYSEDIASTGRNEYPRYPVETLFERQGDCEDTSVLATAILTKMGFDVSLLLFEKFDHMGVGVNYYELEYGNSWIADGKRYWYFDTTGGRSVGWTPEEYAKTAAYVLPVTD